MRLLMALVFWSFLSPSLAAASEGNGKQIYHRFCAACHTPSFETESIWCPSLRQIVQNSEPEDLVRTIDRGQFRRAGKSQSGSHQSHPIPVMPSWSWLSDQELAELVNFLTKSMADEHIPLSALEVKALRNPGTGSALSQSERQAANHTYLQHCAGCHGAKREGVIGPPLSRWPLENLSMEQIRSTLHYGTLDGMPEWGVSVKLTAHQMTLLARYLQERPISQPPVFDITAMRDSWSPPENELTYSNSMSEYVFTLLHDARQAIFVDPQQKKVVAHTDIGFSPYDVLQEREIWILTREGWVVQINPMTKEVRAQARAGYEPAAMALVRANDPDGEDVRYLAVTTVSPPGISYFHAESLEPVHRIDTPEPLGAMIGARQVIAVLTRHTGCIHPLEGLNLALADDCIAGVPYPRYATQIPNTPYNLLVGETGEVAVYDADQRKVVAHLDLGPTVTPSRGALVNHREYGQVFLMASMTSSGMMMIGADPENRAEHAWQILEEIEAPTLGALFVASHQSSDFIVVDSPLNPESAGSVHLLDQNDFSTRQLAVAREARLQGTPRSIQPIFNSSGTEAWITVWNRADQESALVVLETKSGRVKSVVSDNLLTTPIRSFWVYAK